MRIRPDVAESMLNQAEVTFDALTSDNEENNQSGDGWFARDLGVTVHMSLNLSPPEDVELPVILGYRVGSDLSLARQMVVLYAEYDGLGIDPDGTVFPSANHNASGMGMLLEVAKLWNEESLDPRRSVLFVAWSGHLDPRVAQEFFSERFNFRHLITNNPNDLVSPATVIQLDYAGAGGDTLIYHPESSEGMVTLLEESAQDLEIFIESGEDPSAFPPTINVRGTDWISLRWADSDISPLDDEFRLIEREKVQSFGEALSLMLIKLVRESDF